jgi:hypothetical protein
MPTPFTHLYAAQAALTDPLIPESTRQFLNEHQRAYLLGSVVADGHFLAKLRRADTHFYSYDEPITVTPWRVMFMRYPRLWLASDADPRAFLAGYVFHLTLDEVWTMEMLAAHFGHGQWGTQQQRFLMLHVMLIGMDERDLGLLDERSWSAMHESTPGDWLPFLPAPALREWGDLMYDQVKPNGYSKTFDIIAPRVGMTPDELRTLMLDHERAERELWVHIPRETLAQVEARMVEAAREQLLTYLHESAKQPTLYDSENAEQ